MTIETPCYIIYEKKLLDNLKKIEYVRGASGAKSLLALKCFSSWCVFGLMRKYMDGTTSSSPYEARLGRENFGKEVHAYSVAYSAEDVKEAVKYSDKIIFNSVSQLLMFRGLTRGEKLGLRVNPGLSYSHFDFADPARRYSRLGTTDRKSIEKVLPLISGVMFHYNCENDDYGNFFETIDLIGRRYSYILGKLEWVSLGGGFYFTKDNYPLEKFAAKLKEFSVKYGVQVYLEPGEAAITQSTELVTTVLDVVKNEIEIAVVDASTEAHMLDLLIYGTPAKIDCSGNGRHRYMVAGRSCLAGDVFGIYNFKEPLKPGSRIRFSDAAGYSMVKKNWFNGLRMPSIAVKRLGGKVDVVRRFNYRDFKNNLS